MVENSEKETSEPEKPKGKRKTPEELKAWSERLIADILKFKPNPPPGPPLRTTPLEKKSGSNKSD